MKRLLMSLTTTAAILCSTATLHAQVVNLIENGSFETGDFTAWTFSGNGYPDNRFYGATDGSYAVNLHNGDANEPSAVFSQSFPTVPGISYEIRFDLGCYAPGSSAFPQLMRVQVTGTSERLNQEFATYGSGGTTWDSKQSTFVADATSSVLMFTDISPSGIGQDGVLDHVRVTATAVPEPASFAMVGGVLLLSLAAWRACGRQSRD